jgi:hypothetical protein
MTGQLTKVVTQRLIRAKLLSTILAGLLYRRGLPASLSAMISGKDPTS